MREEGGIREGGVRDEGVGEGRGMRQKMRGEVIL